MKSSFYPCCLLLIATLSAVSASPLVIKGNKFFYESTGGEFQSKGIAYQLDEGVDPLHEYFFPMLAMPVVLLRRLMTCPTSTWWATCPLIDGLFFRARGTFLDWNSPFQYGRRRFNLTHGNLRLLIDVPKKHGCITQPKKSHASFLSPKWLGQSSFFD